MNVNLRIVNSDLTAVITSFLERRLRFALGRFGGRVGEVTVRLSTDGRVENRCRISTEVLPFGRVAVEESDPDLFSAIDRAASRIGRLFGRELERIRDARTGRESVRNAA